MTTHDDALRARLSDDEIRKVIAETFGTTEPAERYAIGDLIESWQMGWDAGFRAALAAARGKP
jgi:hypothetical protein